MKNAKAGLLIFIFLFVFCCNGCNKTSTFAPASLPPESDITGFSDGSTQGTAGNGSREEGQPAEGGSKSKLYDPSIYVIQVSGTWQQEVVQGYFADYECELYLNKVDANDSRKVPGNYTGFLWMKTTLDTGAYLKDFLKDVPVEMNFEAGGEGICENMNVFLYMGSEVDNTWPDYRIPDDQGKSLPVSRDTSVARGSVLVVGKEANLTVKAEGMQGVTVEHQDNQFGDAELDYILHVSPDGMETGNQRKVILYLRGEGFSATLEGLLHRLPGYPEDMMDYINEGKYQEALNKHLE